MTLKLHNSIPKDPYTKQLWAHWCENFLNYCSWFDHHISKSQTKLQAPGCEKLRTQLYRENNSIHIFNIQNDKKFPFEPLMMMDLCKIWKLWNHNLFTNSRSRAQPSCKVALWLGNRQNLGHSGFSLHQNIPFFIQHFIAFDLFGPPPKHCSNY